MLQLSFGALMIIVGLLIIMEHEQAFNGYFSIMENTYKEQHEWATELDNGRQRIGDQQIMNPQSISGKELLFLLEGYSLINAGETVVDFEGTRFYVNQFQENALLIDVVNYYQVFMTQDSGREVIQVTLNEL